MSRTQKVLLAVGALVIGALVVLVDMKREDGKQARTVPNVARGVEARLAAAGKTKEAALVAEACDHGGCSCAAVAGRHGLDVDAHDEVLGVLAIASQMCP